MITEKEDVVERKRVLVLTADVGFGHRSAANAIVLALKELYPSDCQVDVVNPLDDRRAPLILRETQTDYDKIVRVMPDVYKMQFQISDAAVPKAIIEKALVVMLYTLIKDILHQYQPDVVVTTHPMFPEAVNAVLAIESLPISIVTVTTDLTMVHRIWFNEDVNLCLVPTEEVAHQALQYNIARSKVYVTGIPIHPQFAQETRPAVEIRKALGWDADKTTVLVVGSKRVKNLEPVLHILNHSGFPMQLVLVAGGDDKLYEYFQTTEWHLPIYRYNYVDRMPAFLHAADCVVTKAGGLIVTEALACGLPMLLVDITPGQEEGNASYVIQHGAGELAESPLQALEILCHWLAQDRSLLCLRSQNARALGTPRSAFDCAELIWALANQSKVSLRESRLTLIPRIRDLLNQFGIPA